MPRFAPQTGARILERLELKLRFGKSHATPVGKQPFAIGGDEMRHGAAEPDVAVEPETAVHRVDHSVLATGEFANLRVRRVIVGHRPTIANCLLADELTLGDGRR